MIPPWLWPERLVNRMAYPLRQAIGWRRRGYRETADDPQAVIAAHPRQARLADLADTYRPALADRFSAANVLENLDVLHLLDAARLATPWQPPERLTALDVGAKNFYYAPALHAFWSRLAPLDSLVGVEVDAYRVYRDGHSRFDYAEAYAAGLPGTRFVAADIRAHGEPATAVTLLFPFVTPVPLIRWGLPDRLLAPEDVLRHVWNLVAPGGLLIIVNQDEAEAAIQQALCDRAGLSVAARFCLTDPILDDRPPRYVTTAMRPPV